MTGNVTALGDIQDTIVAIASPTSPAARGVVRLSGDDTSSILKRLGIDVCGPEALDPSKNLSRRARRLEAKIDVGPPLGRIPLSVLWWPTRRSYTGQPAAELHTFGSLPILTSLVATALASGARAAKPGEFTMRAFLAGRLDLTQAEAVLGVIEAEQRGSLDHALRQLAGNLSRPLEQIRSELLNALADVEAGLDFVDEDIEFISDAVLVERLEMIREQIEATWRVLQQRGGGAVQPVIALRGEPNAGKSCLLNRLADKQAAIVADIPGTTRDVVTADAWMDRFAVTLVDTAGIEDGQSEVDRRSQDQALRASQHACVRLWCVDCSRRDFVEAAQRLTVVARREQRERTIDFWVATKADLLHPRNLGHEPTGIGGNLSNQWIECSASNGMGIEPLKQRIAAAISQRDTEETGSVVGTAARCSESLRTARDALAEAIRLTRDAEGHELVAAEMRSAAHCLGEVTGAVYTDDILDRVFSRFCIGK